MHKRGQKYLYLNTLYHSSWEVYIAKLLKYGDIKFFYEYKRYYLPNGDSFLPDFFLPEYSCWIEVKGQLTRRELALLRAFVREHKLVYIGPSQMRYILGKSPTALSSINLLEYQPTADEIARLKDVIARRDSYEAG